MQRQFNLHPSHYLASMLIVAHGTTLAALYPLAFPIWAKTALAFLVLLSMGYHLRREAWLSAPSATVALTLEDDLAVLTQRNGDHLTCKILHDSLVTPFLTVLNVLPQDTRIARSIVILPDSMDAASFRQLRVWLKWGN
jgi:toxin CptA